MFYAAYFAVLGLVLPFLGPYLAHRGAGPVAIGLITAAFSLGKLVYSPVVGALVDSGRWFRGLLSLHMALAVAVAASLTLIEGLVALLLAFFLIGLGYGTVLPLVEASILERVSAGTYGRLRLWGSLGFVAVAMTSGAWLGAARPGHFDHLLVLVLILLAAACVPFESLGRPHLAAPGVRLPAVVWGLLVVLTLQQVAHGPYYAFFSIHLEGAGFSKPAISGLWSLGVLAELVAFSLGGRLEAGLGLKRLLGLVLLLSPLRWLLLALPPTWPTLLLAQLGHAVTFALAHLAGVQLVQRTAPSGAVRQAQALYSGLAFGLGIVLGSSLAGPVYAAAGGGGAFLAAAAVSVPLLTGWWFLAPRLHPREA